MLLREEKRREEEGGEERDWLSLNTAQEDAIYIQDQTGKVMMGRKPSIGV